jgi:predicted phage baseplate assembly protein
VIADTVVVEIDEGAGWVRWDRRDALLYDIGPDGRIRLSTPDARNYVVRFDGNGRAWVQFGGDGRFGMRPPVGTNNIRAAFVEGGGAAGNAAPHTIREALTAIPGLRAVTNPQAATGGQDGQSEVEAARIGPAAFRARERAVTLEDYEAMAMLAGGVAKTHARAASWNRIDLHVGAAGPQLAPLSETLRRRLMAFLDERKMAGTAVRVVDAVPVPINLTVDVYYDERYRPDAVRQGAQEAILALLAYDRVDFGQPVYLGAMHDALLRVGGVRAANIRLFNRADSTDNGIDAVLASASLPPLESLPLELRAALSRQVEADGRIEIAPEEIAVPGAIEVLIAVGVT